jgi:MFS family permease
LRAASAGERHINIKCASLIGHSIECFDFYIYATAAVLVFPRLFFPTADPAVATLQSLATFALAFLARPIGSVVFGHLGDRIGRKSTLIAAVLGVSAEQVIGSYFVATCNAIKISIGRANISGSSDERGVYGAQQQARLERLRYCRYRQRR